MAGTKITAIVAAMPPAVCRMIAPRPGRACAHTHSRSRRPAPPRARPGLDSDTPWPCRPGRPGQEERAKATTPRRRASRVASDRRLGGEHRAAARHRGERRADQPGAVLGANASTPSTLTAQHRVLGMAEEARAAAGPSRRHVSRRPVSAREGMRDHRASPERRDGRDQPATSGSSEANGAWPIPSGAPRRRGQPGDGIAA